MTAPSETKTLPIPKLEAKLAGQHNYAEWILSVEMSLGMIDIGTHTFWDIVTRQYKQPEEETEKARWQKVNFFFLLTMRKNCENEPLSEFGLYRSEGENRMWSLHEMQEHQTRV